ncbi:DNA-binding protein RFX7-like [Gouania willdenowi]|uniref:RFX-type winged-helix domain-containing protein n=1 Tax=Gouania willdenowi TaxID=441366 RepID=A0A8C5I827_GOUWI|nr:DNA-binding protein RFX7 [Gouania willdenowi]
MAEESLAGLEPQQPRPVESLAGLQGAELRIKSSICKSVQLKVESILHDVERFSDIEKLYLYLKLPSYPNSNADKSDHSALSSSRIQQVHAFSWIRNHLEEYPETSLPKQEVYDEYKNFCDNLNYQPLSAADFGKMMKNVFPTMKARRLGMRGKSKYCYSGLRKRLFVHMPSLPTLDLNTPADGSHCDILESPGQLSSIQEDVRFAACDLVCEWAQKVLKRQFDAVEDLARFLIDSHYINNKSLAALTMMTGTAAEVKTPQSISAFVPTAEAHTLQPHTTTLSSPSVDAKQQLQRKIQRKQQEQKLQSPAPREEQTKRVDDSVPCETPTPPVPQPTIGIVVTAVPSPIPIQRSGQLMSQSPVATLESKMLPINIQMVTQPTKSIKPYPKVLQNIIPSNVGDRTARQRYAQILPKPSATTAIALRSPSTMIIANNPVKTVMTSCHVSPVNFVTMTAISLAPSSSETTTSLMTNALCSTPVSLSSAPTDDFNSNQSMRSVSAAPILASVAAKGHTDNSQKTDIEMVNLDFQKDSQSPRPNCQDMPQTTNLSKGAGGVQRAASVPIPQSKGFLGLSDYFNTKNNGNSPLHIHALATLESSNNAVGEMITPQSQNAGSALLSSCRTSSFDESISTKEGLVSRKRSGLSPDFSPVKRVFTAQQSAEGTAGHGIHPRPGAPVRPESAPATRELEMRMNSALSTQVQTVCTSSFRASGFYSVAKTQSSMERDTISVMETGTSVSHPLTQQQQGHIAAMATPTNPSFQRYLDTDSTTGNIERAPEQTCTPSNSAVDSLDFLNQSPSANQVHVQTDMDYIHFDDDLTQDSIMEELVQMEEQMKLNRLQELRGCAMLQSHQSVMTNPSANHTATYYHPANNHSNPIQTPTPTPTPTSEMIGGGHSLKDESPCSQMASTTPVDSALGSSRYTPAGTPHSNCSSTVPPSPVECRNPFAFTPINSNITSFPDNNSISSSPVKPMQRPMATHPDKARLEWMNNSYNSSCSGNTNKSNSGMGILPSYQGYQFQKPHAFAIPHVRHHESHCSRLTPISPVQQQLTSMANMSRQEGFAVPAPLDNKTTNSSAGTFRCRSVSPAVHQKNMIGNPGSSVPHSIASAFNSPALPEDLNIFANSQTNLGVSSMAQRSRSVPLNIMMQTKVLPTTGKQCTNQNISNVLLKKLDGEHNDSVRGVGLNNSTSTYTACMNLTQMLESGPDLSCTNSHINMMNSDSPCKLQRPIYPMENNMNDSLSLSASDNQLQLASGDHLTMLAFRSLQQQQCDFNHNQELLTGSGRSAGHQVIEQASPLLGGGVDLSSELSSSNNDLSALDTHLLFDPSLQQGSYQNSIPEELVNNQLFQQITSEAAHASDLDWLESKDHPTVGLMG